MDAQEAYSVWKEYLFLNDISTFEELSLIQRNFLYSLYQRYNNTWKREILKRVEGEFYNFYDQTSAEGVKIQALYLDELESGVWQMIFEDENEDHLVHVYFKGWDIDYLA